MSRRNQLTSLHREVLSPLIGKIITGIRHEPSPRNDLFSNKMTLRLRSLDKNESEVFLGLHYKVYGPPQQRQRILNIGVNLLMTEGIEHYTSMEGFAVADHELLHQLLRQPITGFHLTPEQTLVVIFAHGSLIVERDIDEEQHLHLHWYYKDADEST